MKIAVVDSRIPSAASDALKVLGYELCLLPPSPALAKPVSAHPDMLLFFAPDALYCTKEYAAIAFDQIQRIATASGLKSVQLDLKQKEDYPNDILFNAATVGKHLFCLPNYTAKEILNSGYKQIVPVKQGYAKCSTLAVGDNALITEDPSIAKAAEAHGIDVLKIVQNAVALPGYSAGFLGGAASHSPYRELETIFFCGNLDLHPNADEIRAFCFKHGKNPVSLGAFPLTDVGTIFLL